MMPLRVSCRHPSQHVLDLDPVAHRDRAEQAGSPETARDRKGFATAVSDLAAAASDRRWQCSRVAPNTLPVARYKRDYLPTPFLDCMLHENLGVEVCPNRVPWPRHVVLQVALEGHVAWKLPSAGEQQWVLQRKKTLPHVGEELVFLLDLGV